MLNFDWLIDWLINWLGWPVPVADPGDPRGEDHPQHHLPQHPSLSQLPAWLPGGKCPYRVRRGGRAPVPPRCSEGGTTIWPISLKTRNFTKTQIISDGGHKLTNPPPSGKILYPRLYRVMQWYLKTKQYFFLICFNETPEV